MTEVWRLDMATTDKMVLLALADAANDDGVTWIAVASRKATSKLDLLKKTNLSERAVQGALKRLVESGHLSRADKVGRGTIWTITPAGNAPPQEMPPAPPAPRTTCAPADDDTNPRSRCGETVSNHQPTSEAKASSVARTTVRRRFVPDDWQPKASHVERAQTMGLDLHAQTEAFRNHEFKDPKSDFDRAFFTWLRNAPTFAPKAQNGQSAKLTARHDNYEASWAGSESAAGIVAARRAL